MLRPACLLPAERLSPLHGLLTPRSGTEVSLHYLGPATRRTDAYRDGTLTRGSGAASQGQTSPFGIQFFLSVTTHHACIVAGRTCRRATAAWAACALRAGDAAGELSGLDRFDAGAFDVLAGRRLVSTLVK